MFVSIKQKKQQMPAGKYVRCSANERATRLRTRTSCNHGGEAFTLARRSVQEKLATKTTPRNAGHTLRVSYEPYAPTNAAAHAATFFSESDIQ